MNDPLDDRLRAAFAPAPDADHVVPSAAALWWRAEQARRRRRSARGLAPVAAVSTSFRVLVTAAPTGLILWAGQHGILSRSTASAATFSVVVLMAAGWAAAAFTPGLSRRLLTGAQVRSS